MGQKAIFFDIDGTLWDFRNRIPDSTRLAIDRLRQKGHLCFINSGRTRGFISHPHLLSLGFDGIVSGCGTMIEYRDRVIFRRLIEPALAVRTVDIIRKHHVRPIPPDRPAGPLGDLQAGLRRDRRRSARLLQGAGTGFQHDLP